ncbi:uncharacterized protein G2W53_042904 [Senna tora]|uniref:Uncharacterized protein n=1 Tax=Senna tora TaxID=362788 RepID=A0A834VZC4_9FABA|nr:uncharacterized protein G2W53_042904 [Senna tora]
MVKFPGRSRRPEFSDTLFSHVIENRFSLAFLHFLVIQLLYLNDGFLVLGGEVIILTVACGYLVRPVGFV